MFGVAACAAATLAKYNTPPPWWNRVRNGNRHRAEAGVDGHLHLEVCRLIATSRPGLQLVMQPVGGLPTTTNESSHRVGEIVDVAMSGGPADKLQRVRFHVAVAGRRAVAPAVVRALEAARRGAQCRERSGRRAPQVRA